MPRKLFQRITPSREFVRNHKALATIAHLLEDPNLFHLTRSSVSRAFAIGLGVAMTPLYGHMLIAALLAIWLRANLAISIILVWLSNPLTFPAMLLVEYWIGAQILGVEEKVQVTNIDFHLWRELLAEVWRPLLLGSAVLSISSAIIGYYAIQWTWQFEVNRKWRKRKREAGRAS